MVKSVQFTCNQCNTFILLNIAILYTAFLNGEEGRRIVDQLVEQLGTDANYAKCEQECHVLIRNQQSVMQHLCPFTCHLCVDFY